MNIRNLMQVLYLNDDNEIISEFPDIHGMLHLIIFIGICDAFICYVLLNYFKLNVLMAFLVNIPAMILCLYLYIIITDCIERRISKE